MLLRGDTLLTLASLVLNLPANTALHQVAQLKVI